MNLQPIEYYYGNTPLINWIRKCKPSEPKGLGKSVMQVSVIPFELSPTMKLYIQHIEEVQKKLEQDMREYFTSIQHLL